MKQLLAVTVMVVLLCLAGLVMSDAAFAQQCVDNGDGTVTDNGTGLMWQKATAGGPMKWDKAMNYASSLSLGGHSGWWLPRKDELRGLYNSPCKSMMQVQPSDYWSSTTNAYSAFYAWRVSFGYGYVGSHNKSSNYYVRAVRAGQ